MECKAFLNCRNKATTTLPNPILGDVPCCQRCKDKMDRIESMTKRGKSKRVKKGNLA